VNVLIGLACVVGCLVLWILQELVGTVIMEAFWELLKWVFSPILSPIGRALSRLLAGPHGAAWFCVLTLAGIAGAGGGVRLVFTGLGQGDAVECIGGVAAVAGRSSCRTQGYPRAGNTLGELPPRSLASNREGS
jgi:hypothetical protein